MNRFSRRVVLCVLTFTWLAASTTASADDESQRLGRQRPAQQDADRPRDGSLEEGVPAPDFKLKSLDGKRDVQLVAYRGRQPVVLIFGSYT
jgi:hypothetical protein